MESDGILFINELNRMPEATQNTLLPVMDEALLNAPTKKKSNPQGSQSEKESNASDVPEVIEESHQASV